MTKNQTIKERVKIIERCLSLWRYRGFILGMVGREFQSRYLNSLLGTMWAIINPVAMIFVYTVIFSKIMRARLAGTEDTWAYGVFLCAGLLTWNYFAELLSRCQTIFIEHSNMIKKVHFPRTTLPVIIFLSCSVNFLIIFGIFMIFLLITGRFPGWSIIGFVPLLMIQQGIALGLGIFLGTMNVFFRDIGQLVGIVLQFWFWFTPIIYPISILPEKIKVLLSFNPMTRFITSYQQIILYGQWPDIYALRFHVMGAIVFLAAGSFVFKKLSGDIADEL
ncbi:MAG: ABC transporter permease [Pseudomonadota bacterium]